MFQNQDRLRRHWTVYQTDAEKSSSDPRHDDVIAETGGLNERAENECDFTGLGGSEDFMTPSQSSIDFCFNDGQEDRL